MGFRSNSSWPAPFRRLLHKCDNRLRMVTQGQVEQPAGERSVALVQRQQPARRHLFLRGAPLLPPRRQERPRTPTSGAAGLPCPSKTGRNRPAAEPQASVPRQQLELADHFSLVEDPNRFFSAVHVFACFPATASLRRAGLGSLAACGRYPSIILLRRRVVKQANGVGRYVREFRFDSGAQAAAHEVLVLIRKSPNRRRT